MWDFYFRRLCRIRPHPSYCNRHKPKHPAFVFRWLFLYGTKGISPKLIPMTKLCRGSSGHPQGPSGFGSPVHIWTDDDKPKICIYVIQKVIWPCNKISSLDLWPWQPDVLNSSVQAVQGQKRISLLGPQEHFQLIGCINVEKLNYSLYTFLWILSSICACMDERDFELINVVLWHDPLSNWEIFVSVLSTLTSGVNLELDARESVVQLILKLIGATRKTKWHSLPWTRN